MKGRQKKHSVSFFPHRSGRNLTWQWARSSPSPELPSPAMTWPLRGSSEDGTGFPAPGTGAWRGGSLPQFPHWEGSRTAPETLGPLRLGSAPIPTACDHLFIVENLAEFWGFAGGESRAKGGDPGPEIGKEGARRGLAYHPHQDGLSWVYRLSGGSGPRGISAPTHIDPSPPSPGKPSHRTALGQNRAQATLWHEVPPTQVWPLPGLQPLL